MELTKKRLGIWMDHSSAHLIEFTSKPIKTTTITSLFTHHEKVESIKKSEGLMHHKEQHQQATYNKILSESILTHDEVLLFGPTDAKTELYNTIKDNHLFENVNIEIQNADYMTNIKNMRS